MTSEQSEPTPATGGPQPFGYRPALDGVRTVAVYLVLAFHAGMSSLANGYLGVDLFFVLSGYLITSILLVELVRSDKVRFRTFYARRFRRLLPASAVLLVVGALVSLGTQPVTARLGFADDARSAALYVANWHYIDVARDYFAEGTQSSPFLHFWSLSIEEQFYVFFPVVLLVVWRAGRGNRHVVAAVIGALALASLAAQVVIGADDVTRSYYGTDTRIYQILLGCGLAVATRLHGIRLGRRTADAAAIVGLGLLLLLSTSAVDMSISTRGIAAAVLSVVLVAGLEGESSLATRVASAPAFVHLGRISYGTYLWHWPVIVALGLVVDLAPWVLAIVAAIIATALAELSAAAVEMPVRSNRRLDKVPLVAVSLGLVGSLVVAALAPAILRRPAAPVITTAVATTAPSSDRPFPSGLVGPDITDVDWDVVTIAEKSIGPNPPLCRMGDTTGCALHEGSGLRVLVAGDSHALMLNRTFQRFAEEHDLMLFTQISTGCSWVEGVTDHLDGGTPCHPLRDGWTTDLVTELDVDVVIVLERTRRAETFGAGQKYTFDDPALAEIGYPDAYSTLMNAAFDRIEAAGARVVVIDYTPEATDDRVECLAAGSSLESCSWIAGQSVDPIAASLTARDERDDSLDVVSLDDIACPNLPWCIPYLDGQFVYRDRHHVQPDWWLAHFAEIDQRLGRHPARLRLLSRRRRPWPRRAR